MQYSAALFLTMASLAVAATPDGCHPSYSGHFELGAPVNNSAPASTKEKRQELQVCSGTDITLNNSVLIDHKNRTGEIVANHQFQFDFPLQNPRIASDGFSICDNDTLAAPTSGTVFYSCKSGGFSNIYDQSIGAQCTEVYLPIIRCQPNNTDTSVVPSDTGSASAPAPTMSAENVGAMVNAPAASAAPTSASTPSSAPAVASTGSPAASGNSTSFSAGKPSSTSAPETFKGAADSLAVGKVLGVVALGLAGFAFAL